MDMSKGAWNTVYQTFSGHEALLFISGSITVFSLVFWLTVGLFTLVDITGRPEWVLNYKIQPQKNTPVSWIDVRRLLCVVVSNQLVVGIPSVCLLYPAQKAMGMVVDAEIPPVAELIKHLIIFAIVEEIGFYYSHRLLHHPLFYKSIHKQHHEWTSPIALVTVYAHPVEFFVSSLLPLFAGPALCGAHPVTSWVWYSLALMTTIIHHSGYHLPGLPSPEFHDYHHLKFNQNYGVLGILDWIHGTDVNFRQSKQFERHKVIFSALK